MSRFWKIVLLVIAVLVVGLVGMRMLRLVRRLVFPERQHISVGVGDHRHDSP